MKNLYKQKRAQGFTIIEVMIVLAIAAVILLIVLLAVPALQRNARNTGRNQDAGQLAAAVNNCLANNNGNPANCVALGNNAVDYDVNSANQLTNVSYDGTGTPAGAGVTPTTTQMVWSFGANAAPYPGVTCGTGVNAGKNATASSTRQFTIRWSNEASGGGRTLRCTSS